MKGLIALFGVAGLMGGGAGVWYMNAGSQAETRFRTAVVERGNLVATVTATGTLEPEDAIDVGAQVAGQIKRFGRDPRDPSKPIDFGAVVEEGTILAQLDDSIYASQMGQARANVQKAQADLDQAKAKFNQADRDWNRVRRLMATKGIVSEVDYDSAQSVYESAKAVVAVCEAAVAQAKETLSQAEINLGYTTIRSPVKGVILDRRVNVGQTVVASLNAPSLFLIATDLTKLQIWASVNEADIGVIHQGLGVRFSVDAFPEETFEGKVSQIRLNATMTMNVVTYTVVVDTDNSHQRLLPYMTANLQFLVNERKDVLMAPNGALRWKPQSRLVAPEYRDEYARSLKRRPGNDKVAEKERQNTHHVWVLDDRNFVRPVKVRTGLSDGTLTEIISGEIHESTAVVVGASVAIPEESSVNPFAPTMPVGKK